MACDGDDSSGGGGSGSDGGAGSGSGDMPSVGKVAVTVLSDSGDGMPDTGAIAIFIDKDHSLVQQGFVGPMAKAEVSLAAGGIVHVMRVTQTGVNQRQVKIVSVRNVKPGDTLTFGSPKTTSMGLEPYASGTFTPTSGATSYEFYHSCGTGVGDANSKAITIYAAAGCLSPTFDVLGVGVGPGGPFYAFGQGSVTGGFTLPEMQRMPYLQLELHNIPSAAVLVASHSTLLAPAYDLAHFQQEERRELPPATLKVSLGFPSSAARLGLTTVTLGHGPDAGSEQISAQLEDRVGNIFVDLNRSPLPRITSKPRFSGAVVAWSQEGAGTPDVRMVRALSSHILNGVTYSVTWTVIDDASEAFLQLPGLPAMFAEFDPTQQPASLGIGATVQYLEQPNLLGYDEVRNLPFEALFSSPTPLFRGVPYFKRINSSAPVQ